MLREVAVFVVLYGFVLCMEKLHQTYKRRAEARKKADKDEEALEAFSSLGNLGLEAGLPRFLLACCGVVVSNPMTLETFKHYAVHFLIYSGYVIPGH